MALPKINQPRFKHTLASSGKQIFYRGFTVKEQKILLTAKQLDKQEQIIEAIKQVLELCTFGEVDINSLPIFDIEDLFIRIRSVSVSDELELKYKVKDTKESITVKIKLEDVKVTFPKEHNKKIMISDELGVMMKYPSINMIDSNINEFDMIASCIDYVFDKSEVYPFSEVSKKEIDDFMDSLDSNILLEMKKFFDTMPRLRHSVTVKLKDGTSETIKFEGLNDFFD